MKNAIVIDDDDMIRTVIAELLAKLDFEVDTAEDGWEGVRMVKKGDYNIILLDIRMPGVDGEQVLSILNKFDDSLPVLIVSAYLTKERVAKLKKLGVKGFLTKPIDPKSFNYAVKQISRH
ncbi:response regulator [candidate division KSB1 bacterium]